MDRVTVQVDPDHYRNLFGTAKSGLVELIRNGLDADAFKVSVTFDRNMLGGIDKVVVTDNGEALPMDQVEATFGRLGGSWKAMASTTNAGRDLLGKRGKGRFSAFSLGSRVEWRFVSFGPAGKVAMTLRADSSSPGDVAVEVEPALELPIGARVTAWNTPETAGAALGGGRLRDAVLLELAPHLIKYPDLEVWIDGDRLDPSPYKVRTQIIDVPVASTPLPVEVQVIEWSRDFGRDLHLCAADGVTRYSTGPGIRAPGFNFTAYLRWDGFAAGDAVLADLWQEPGATVLEAAKEALRTYFRQRGDEVKEEIVPQWISEGVYPYDSQVEAGPTEAVEREAFDRIAVVAATTINEGSTQSRRLSLLLLREALASRPGSLHVILREVLNLTEAQVDELAEMLQFTSLGAVIRASRLIADRLNFTYGLSKIVADPESRRATLERTQLHRILAAETWVFAEEFALIGDDQRLQDVLRAHLARLGEEVELHSDPVGTRPDGTGVIPDLVLSGAVARADNHVHNLVVELKRPSVNVGVEEFRQLEDYALAVTSDVRFNQPNVSWEFWIVGNQVKPEVLALTGGTLERPVQTVAGGTAKVRACTWAEVISNAEHRLKFVRGSLEDRVTEESART
jgi:hypothetical protein